MDQPDYKVNKFSHNSVIKLSGTSLIAIQKIGGRSKLILQLSTTTTNII